jgi:oxygen-independent coproporphyrinogen III oxidase
MTAFPPPDPPPRPSVPAGVYVHWPFCRSKCPYCDFYSLAPGSPERAGGGAEAAYLVALLDEIRSSPHADPAGRDSGPAAIDTIYFGGGTPSLMGPAALEAILGAIGQTFSVAPGAEVTLEVNPTAAETAALGEMLGLGVNRLSVGAQSFDDRVLAQLGRAHDAATTRRAIERMRQLGVDNLSLDLIFAVPGQTLAGLRADMDALLEFAPEHVSAYGLTVHEGTPFGESQRQGRLELPEDDLYAAMYEALIDRLTGAGLEHYEISNWPRPGLASRHNSKYWRQANVAGFGPSAHGTWGRRRTENAASLAAYLARDPKALGQPCDPPVSERARMGEVMMLVLRRVGGAPWAEINAWTGRDACKFYAVERRRLRDDGLIDESGEAIRLTRRGLLLADSVMLEFF